jgi:iron complex transport system substrate-binding protein
VRVVSHTCSNTEIVCALGCEDFLVGVDSHSDYPPVVVRDLPKIGPDLDIDVKNVILLKPDLVLSSLTVPGHERIVDALYAAKLPVLIMSPVSLEDVYSDIERISVALGVPERGRELSRNMRCEARCLQSRRLDRPSILVEWWPKPVIVPGKHSWVTDMIAAVGGSNPFADRDCKSTPVTDAEVISAAPAALVLSWCGMKPDKVRIDVARNRKAWSNVPALATDNIYRIAEAWLGRPGPRLTYGLRALQSIVVNLGQGSPV